MNDQMPGRPRRSRRYYPTNVGWRVVLCADKLFGSSKATGDRLVSPICRPQLTVHIDAGGNR